MEGKYLSDSEIDGICAMYNNGRGTCYIANVVGVHRSTVQYQLKKRGIALRSCSPYSAYDVNFFNKYTPESCYWAGFILADGCIRSDRDGVDISSNDMEQLEKFSKCISYTGSIFGKNGDRGFSMLICGKWYSNMLMYNFDITPRKSLTMYISKKVPDELMSHYIRGFFDGNGYITTSCNCAVIGYASGSIHLMQQIVDMFYKFGIRVKREAKSPVISQTCKNGYHVRYSGKNAKKILDWMYTNSTEDTRMDRKYNRYLEYFNGSVVR